MAKLPAFFLKEAFHFLFTWACKIPRRAFFLLVSHPATVASLSRFRHDLFDTIGAVRWQNLRSNLSQVLHGEVSFLSIYGLWSLYAHLRAARADGDEIAGPPLAVTDSEERAFWIARLRKAISPTVNWCTFFVNRRLVYALVREKTRDSKEREIRRRARKSARLARDLDTGGTPKRKKHVGK